MPAIFYQYVASFSFLFANRGLVKPVTELYTTFSYPSDVSAARSVFLECFCCIF